MIRIPLFIIHISESLCRPCLLPHLCKYSDHPIVDFGNFLVQNKDILLDISGESDWCSGWYIVSIEGNAQRIINGNDLTLIVFSPIFYQSNVGSWLECYWEAVLYHLLWCFLFIINFNYEAMNKKELLYSHFISSFVFMIILLIK